ncbi:MAG TPA: 3-mercaptopyruvate sulfurtransferase [Sphingopyxis sp.]|nr:3-mercaptopyruvate sulfurtransferase [Sphingopyxis sp.]
MDALVTTDWLESELGASDLRIVDATKFMADSDRDARAEYAAGHIPGAVFMDLTELVDVGNSIENMAPQPEKFASRMQSLGLGDGSRIVLYDDSPLNSAARAWWLLKLFGAHDVALLDGGLAKWKAEGRQLEMGKQALRHRHFTVWRDAAAVRTKDQVAANLESGAEQLVDARPAARFTGAERDPRPGMAPGHIPGSRNLPHNQLFQDNGTWKQGDELKAAFDAAGVDLTKPLVTTCGSGMTASVLAFGAHLLGKEDVAVYDGSWTEWGADPATPKTTGPAS